MTAQDTAWRERGHRFCSRQQFDWIWDAASESKQHTDRETLMMTLHVQGAFCGLCDYESAIYDDRSDGVEWRCEDCERTLGGYADAILAAPSLSLVAAREEIIAATLYVLSDEQTAEDVADALFASGILKPSSEVEAAALARAWERGIHDLHEHKLIYDAWRYNYRDHPGDGPTNPHSGEVFHRTAVQHRPDWWVNPYPADADSTLGAARVRSGKAEA